MCFVLWVSLGDFLVAFGTVSDFLGFHEHVIFVCRCSCLLRTGRLVYLSGKLVISHLNSFDGASHQGLLVWERFT